MGLGRHMDRQSKGMSGSHGGDPEIDPATLIFLVVFLWMGYMVVRLIMS